LQNIPVKFFSKYIKGKHEGKTVKLRSDSSKRTWKVKIEGHTLTDGWKEFVEAHDLRISDFVIFKHKGDMFFDVTALGSSCCEVQYAPSCSHGENEESDEIGESSRKEKEIEENIETEPDQFSSDLTCFSQSVTTSNLMRDSVGVPRDFAKRYGFNIGRHEIVLMNEEGKPWESEVISYKSGKVIVAGGWKSLCTESKLEVGDSCTFKLLHNAKMPVFRLCSKLPKAGAEARPLKRARVQRWSQESRSKHDVREKIAEEGEPSRRNRTSNKSTGDQGKLQQTQSCFIFDHVAKVNQSVDNMGKLLRKKHVNKRIPETEAKSFSLYKSCFVAYVTDWNLREDTLSLPRNFVRSDGLIKGSNKIVLMNEGARTWTLILKFRDSRRSFYSRGGWRSFCRENGLKPGDSVTFKLESSNTKTPLLLFSIAESKSASTKDRTRFLTLTVTPSSIRSSRLYLSKKFISVNKMERAGGKKITLLDKNGEEWPVTLLMDKRYTRMVLGSGLREFCNAIGVKAYESVVLELVWEETTTLPMFKFCSKIKT
jgi:hypothetical protein